MRTYSFSLKVKALDLVSQVIQHQEYCHARSSPLEARGGTEKGREKERSSSLGYLSFPRLHNPSPGPHSLGLTLWRKTTLM